VLSSPPGEKRGEVGGKEGKEKKKRGKVKVSRTRILLYISSLVPVSFDSFLSVRTHLWYRGRRVRERNRGRKDTPISASDDLAVGLPFLFSASVRSEPRRGLGVRHLGAGREKKKRKEEKKRVPTKVSNDRSNRFEDVFRLRRFFRTKGDGDDLDSSWSVIKKERGKKKKGGAATSSWSLAERSVLWDRTVDLAGPPSPLAPGQERKEEEKKKGRGKGTDQPRTGGPNQPFQSDFSFITSLRKVLADRPRCELRRGGGGGRGKRRKGGSWLAPYRSFLFVLSEKDRFGFGDKQGSRRGGEE